MNYYKVFFGIGITIFSLYKIVKQIFYYISNKQEYGVVDDWLGLAFFILFGIFLIIGILGISLIITSLKKK